MYAECINAALTGVLQMKDTVMDCIEQTFSVKGTALEYDGYLMH
jgi:hypothetical protein